MVEALAYEAAIKADLEAARAHIKRLRGELARTVAAEARAEQEGAAAAKEVKEEKVDVASTSAPASSSELVRAPGVSSEVVPAGEPPGTGTPSSAHPPSPPRPPSRSSSSSSCSSSSSSSSLPLVAREAPKKRGRPVRGAPKKRGRPPIEIPEGMCPSCHAEARGARWRHPHTRIPGECALA